MGKLSRTCHEYRHGERYAAGPVLSFAESVLSFFDNSKTGQLLSRLTSDITEIGELAFRGPHDAVVCCFTMTGTILMLLYLNLPLGLLITVLLLLKTWHAMDINRKMKNAFRENRRRNGELTAEAAEALNGIRIVKSFAQEKEKKNALWGKLFTWLKTVKSPIVC